jgi:hypothetical protein
LASNVWAAVQREAIFASSRKRFTFRQTYRMTLFVASIILVLVRSPVWQRAMLHLVLGGNGTTVKARGSSGNLNSRGEWIFRATAA